MEILNKVQIIGRVMKTSSLIERNGSKWIYVWLDTNLQNNETKSIKIKAFNSHAVLLNNDYMVGSTIYTEGKVAYYNDNTEIQAQYISVINYSTKKQNAVKDAFDKLTN